MAPFPETEDMTIRRLEVAIRRMDFKLLKNGAYKLHEKYHANHQFENLQALKIILDEVKRNAMIPEDIKNILIPTLEDILSSQGNENENKEIVSSLTQLSYSPQAEHRSIAPDEQIRNAVLGPDYKENYTKEPIEDFREEYVTPQPFQEFTLNEPINVETVENNQYSSPISHNNPLINSSSNANPQTAQMLDVASSEDEEVQQQFNIDDILPDPPQIEPKVQEEYKPTYSSYEEIQTETKASQDVKSVAIFFNQEASNEKIKNIAKFRELVASAKDSEIKMADFVALSNEINTQSNISVLELQNVLEQLKTRQNPINLITNSQSANFVELFKSIGMSYSIFDPREDRRISFLPVMGLSNLFKCNQCGYEYLNSEQETNSYILQCPKCRGAMFPNYYSAAGSEAFMNMDYYNMASIALANSDVWLLVHPSLSEKMSMNMLRSTLKVSSCVKEIYILDKDINIKETYANFFSEIDPNVRIHKQPNALEDFFYSIDNGAL